MTANAILDAKGQMRPHPDLAAGKKIKELGQSLMEILALDGYPVGVKLFGQDEPSDAENIERSGAEGARENMRFCQALMKARRGEMSYISRDNLACPAAAKAFGFRELPEGLKSGKALCGFGITLIDDVGRKMFENMPHLEMNQISYIKVYPLPKAEDVPDVVIIEDEVEKLMWVVLSYLHGRGGERVTASTSVLQAACVDSTIIPYKDGRLNYSLGCYGCREATDIKLGESIIGFPIGDLEKIVSHLQYLSKKAMPASRSKTAYSHLISKERSQCYGTRR